MGVNSILYGAGELPVKYSVQEDKEVDIKKLEEILMPWKRYLVLIQHLREDHSTGKFPITSNLYHGILSNISLHKSELKKEERLLLNMNYGEKWFYIPNYNVRLPVDTLARIVSPKAEILYECSKTVNGWNKFFIDESLIKKNEYYNQLLYSYHLMFKGLENELAT